MGWICRYYFLLSFTRHTSKRREGTGGRWDLSCGAEREKTERTRAVSEAERYATAREGRAGKLQLQPGEEGLKPQPLLIPVRLKVAAEEMAVIGRQAALLTAMGIDLQREGQHVTLRAVPLPLRTQNLQILIPELLGYLARQQEVSAFALAQWLARRDDAEAAHWNHSQAIALLTELERLCPQLLKSPPSGLLQAVEIESAINALKHE